MLIPFTPAGVPVIAASAAALLGLLSQRRAAQGAGVSDEIWLTIGVLTVATAAIRAAGPVLLGGRELPGPVQGVIALVAPALLAALVVVETVGAPEGGALELDARVVGVGAAAIALRFGAHDAPGGRARGARNGRSHG